MSGTGALTYFSLGYVRLGANNETQQHFVDSDVEMYMEPTSGQVIAMRSQRALPPAQTRVVTPVQTGQIADQIQAQLNLPERQLPPSSLPPVSPPNDTQLYSQPAQTAFTQPVEPSPSVPSVSEPVRPPVDVLVPATEPTTTPVQNGRRPPDTLVPAADSEPDDPWNNA